MAFLCALLMVANTGAAAAEDDEPAPVATSTSRLGKIVEDAGGFAVQATAGLGAGAICHGACSSCAAGLCGAAWFQQTSLGPYPLLAPLLLPVVLVGGFWLGAVVLLPAVVMVAALVDTLLLGVRMGVMRHRFPTEARLIALLSQLALLPPLITGGAFLVGAGLLAGLMGLLWLSGSSPTEALGRDVLIALTGLWALSVAGLMFGHVLRLYIYAWVRWTQVMHNCRDASRHKRHCRDPLRLDPR